MAAAGRPFAPADQLVAQIGQLLKLGVALLDEIAAHVEAVCRAQFVELRGNLLLRVAEREEQIDARGIGDFCAARRFGTLL
ncbi:MAG: hypothetical protein WDM81_20995 [Rhizomicrobium sp.]